MTALSSPPPSHTSHSELDLESRLDAEIQRVRNEISRIRTQSQHLSAALLGSSRVQKHVASHKTSRPKNPGVQERLEEAIKKQQVQNNISLHRLAVGVTSFPFTDPAPERTGEPAMLGVRFDLSSPSLNGSIAETSLGRVASEERNEDVAQPSNSSSNNTYYVVLRRLQHRGLTYMRLQHNTVPKHIDVLGYGHQYLPLPGPLQDTIDSTDPTNSAQQDDADTLHDDSGIDVTQDIDPNNDTADTYAPQPTTSQPHRPIVQGTSQNLHQFIASIHHDLLSWHNRTQSIRYLRHTLGLRSSPSDAESSPAIQPKHNILDLVQSTNDATQVQITWRDGALALLKIAYDGTVARAVAYGSRVADESTTLGDDDENGDVSYLEVEREVQQKQLAEVSHVRLWDVERILSRDDAADDRKVRLMDVDRRLELLAEKEVNSMNRGTAVD